MEDFPISFTKLTMLFFSYILNVIVVLVLKFFNRVLNLIESNGIMKTFFFNNPLVNYSITFLFSLFEILIKNLYT